MAEQRLVGPAPARTRFGRVPLSRVAMLILLAQLSVYANTAQPAPADAPTHVANGEDRHPPAIDWATLQPTEQQVLAPVRVQWSQLLPAQQQRLRRIAQRWQDAPPARRTAIEQRLSVWAAMTPEQRAARGSRFEQFRKLAPEQQQDLRDAYQRFNALPPEQRQTLRERFETMSPVERDAFVDGMRNAEHNGAWPRFMADVPQADRPTLRTMWFALAPAERHALRRHLRSLSAAERTDLRTRLLAMTPPQRDAFIAQLPRAPVDPSTPPGR
jgi:hypothetical protein